MNKQNELAVVEREPVARSIESPMSSTLAVIERAASNKDIDVEKMERLLQMQERILAKQAESEFNEAMQTVQRGIPRILRDATNPSTNSKYTRLESLLKVVVPIYTAAGFSLSFGTSDCTIPDHYRIVCDVAHKGSAGSFTRHYQCDIPADTTGMKGMLNKTKTHGFGSTMSYGRRYLTLLIFNIALVSEDDDGGKSQKPTSTARVVTPEIRNRFFEVTKHWHKELQAWAINESLIMPDQGLDALPDSVIPTTRGELASLRAKVEEHQ